MDYTIMVMHVLEHIYVHAYSLLIIPYPLQVSAGWQSIPGRPACTEGLARGAASL